MKRKALSLLLVLVMLLSLFPAAALAEGDAAELPAEAPQAPGEESAPEAGEAEDPAPPQAEIPLEPALDPPAEVTISLQVIVEDEARHTLTGVTGGTASLSKTAGHPGDLILVDAVPAAGYQLQYIYYDDGLRMGCDATDAGQFIIPEDYSFVEVTVCFTAEGSSLPLPASNTVYVDLPLPGGSYSGPVEGNAYLSGSSWYDVTSVLWYGGTGSGCQGVAPTSFLAGVNYFPELVLTPHEHWRWTATEVLLAYHDQDAANPFATVLEGGSVCSVDIDGRLHVVGEEITLSAIQLHEAQLDVTLFEEGGNWEGGAPAVLTPPAGAHYSVSSATWYNQWGISPVSFETDQWYFFEFTLVPEPGYTFAEDAAVTLSRGEVESLSVSAGGSLFGWSGLYALDEEAASRYRMVRASSYLMGPDGAISSSGIAGLVDLSTSRPRVGETVTVIARPNPGYRLQWMTYSQDPYTVGDDITDGGQLVVEDIDEDVYVSVFFAANDSTPPVHGVNLNVKLPSPGGNYSGQVPANVTPRNNPSQFEIVSTRWYRIDDGQVYDPASFEAGKTYAVEVILEADPRWRFADDAGVMLFFSDGSIMDLDSPYHAPDGRLIATSGLVTLPAVPVDRVDLALRLPAPGGSYTEEVPAQVESFTPHVSPMYAFWRNAADQETGSADGIPSSFRAGCSYYAVIRLGADQGYLLSDETQVQIENASLTYQAYYELDGSIFLHTAPIVLPEETYSLSGDYIKFRVNGELVSAARPGDYVEVLPEITSQPLGVYLAAVSSDTVTLTQHDEALWSFIMPAEDVHLDTELREQETYIFELEDGVHEMSARDASWLFPAHQPCETVDGWDLDCDGSPDMRITFREDGTALVVRVGNIFGEYTTGTPSGRIGTFIFRFGPQRYELWLGSVQVSEGNKDDIPVLGGHASYDPDSATLTLDGVTGVIGVSQQYEEPLYPHQIRSGGDLTITGSASLTDETLRSGIHCGGNLILQGDFTVNAWLHGVYAAGDLRVTGTLRASGSQVAVGCGGDLIVLLGLVEAESSDLYAIACSGTVRLAGEIVAEAAEYALYGEGDLLLLGGNLHASSRNDIAVELEGALNMTGGTFWAYGNVQAIEASSISLGSDLHILTPSEGRISSDGTTIVPSDSQSPARTAEISTATLRLEAGVRELDGAEGLGGKVDLGDGNYQTSRSKDYINNGRTVTVRAKADTGYLFDHWEDAFGRDLGQTATLQFVLETRTVVTAVFEKLLPINASTFPDADFRTYVSQYDKDGDGYLSRAERAKGTIFCLLEDHDVRNMAGVGYFEALEELVLNANENLASLNLRVNKALRRADLWGNGLAVLKVAGLPLLMELYADGNALTELDISGCPFLLDAVLNGHREETEDCLRYSGGPLGGVLTVDKDVVIVADVLFTLTLDANGEGAAVRPESLMAEKGKALPALPCPAWEGHAFLGWFTEPGGGEPVSAGTVFQENTVLYAHWRLCGDINGDGTVNNKDVSRLINYLKHGNVTFVEGSLDVNGDGTVNNKDVSRLINFIKHGHVTIH